MKSYFIKYNDVTLDYIYTDKHLHTNWVHGKNSVIEVIDKAKKLNLKQVAITEHCRETSSYYPNYFMEVDNYRKKIDDLDIIIGYEAKIKNYNGAIDVSSEINNQSEISIASVHNFPIGGLFYKPNLFEKNLCQEIELRLSLAAIENSDFDILGHAGGQSIKYYKEFPANYFEQIIESCANNDIAFDLNYQYHKNHFSILDPILAKYNPYLSLGSDAHSINYIGSWIKVLKSRHE